MFVDEKTHPHTSAAAAAAEGSYVPHLNNLGSHVDEALLGVLHQLEEDGSIS